MFYKASLLFCCLISSSVPAKDCSINLSEKITNDNRLYNVNGKIINVSIDKGLSYFVNGYEVDNKDKTQKRAFIESEKLCFKSDENNNCYSVDSENNDNISNVFLQNGFCK